MVELSRRKFLMFSAAAAAASIKIPAFELPRDPYVIKGESVSYVGLCPDLGKSPFAGGFSGCRTVMEVKDWDGVGYPCALRDQGYGKPYVDWFYDADLSNFLRDLESGFWHDLANCRRYPNVHAFVREKRFGENPEIFRQRMDPKRWIA